MKSEYYMGIDASSTCTGWSIFSDSKLVDYGAISPKGKDWRKRIYDERSDLNAIIQKYNPAKIFMEDVPLKAKGGLSTLVKLGGVQQSIYTIATDNGIEIEFAEPSTWRSKGGLYDGTREGTKRDVLKKKAIDLANAKFGLDLKWVAPKSKLNEDDQAEAILICAVGLGIVTKERKFGNKRPKSQSKK